MEKSSIQRRFGFTLIELMITIAIIGILAAIALSSYQSYTRRAYYVDVINAVAPYKAAVEVCIQRSGALAGCSAGASGIPAAITTPVSGVASLSVANGVITAVPVAQYGIVAGDTYILTPTLSSTGITWAASGGGVTNGYAS